MAIQLAISDMALAGADALAVVEQVKAGGFDGLEIQGVAHGGLFAGHRLLADPGRTHRALEDAGLHAAALIAPVTLCDANEGFSVAARQTLHGHLITAAELGAPYVCVRPASRRLPMHVLPKVAAALESVLARAAELGVMVAVQNEGQIFGARDLWRLGQLAPSRAWGVCWDARGNHADTPAVAVPMLGTRIVYVRLCATGKNIAGPAAGDAGGADVGTTSVVHGRSEQLILRLRGIGYRGWLGHVPHGAIEPAEAARTAATLRQWVGVNGRISAKV